MQFSNVFIDSVAAIEAPDRITSTALEDDLAEPYRRLGIPARCIASLTGIEARRFWPEGVEVAEAARQAAEAALAKAPHVTKESVGALISTSVSKEYLEPSVAALVHGDLGLPDHALNFDVSNACLGFLTGMSLAGQLLESGQMSHVLVVAGESSRKVVSSTVARLKAPTSTMDDYKGFLPTLTLGSGSVAMVLSHRSVARTSHRLDGVVSLAATNHNRICMGTYDWMRTDAPKLLTEGVSLAQRVWAEGAEKFGWNDANIGQYICHQVGAAHLATLMTKLSLDVKKAFLTYPEFGNMGSAALPFTLAKAVEAGRVRDGDDVALMGIGSGLNCAMAKVSW